VVVLFCLSCRHAPLPGQSDLPPGVVRVQGFFEDIGPRWSHDGRRIAFLRRTTDRHLQLCVTSRDLSRVVPLDQPELVSPDRPYRTGRAGYRAPERLAWSPDDRFIAFSRVEWFTFEDGERLPGTGLWAYDLNTGRMEPLAIRPKKYEDLFYYFRSPQWSPNGKRLAFIGEGMRGETALFVRTLAGTGPRVEMPRYDQYSDVDWPAWSPDGRRLVFRQGILRAPTADPIETLRLIEPGGLEARRLTEFGLPSGSNPKSKIQNPKYAAGLSWSPDGRRLAFTLTPDALEPDRYAVWVLDAEGSEPARRVSPEDGHGYLAPVWMDGSTLGALRPAGLEYDAVAFSADGGPARVLCRLPSDDMDWSPDRRSIVCAIPTKGKPAGPMTLRVYEINGQ
jgi:Tol biopolymer transport system component